MSRLAIATLLLVAGALRAEDKPTLVLDAGGHTATVWKVLFTPDSKEVITVSDDKVIRIWDVATGQPLRVLRPPIGKGNEGGLWSAALSPDGHTLAVGGHGFVEHKRGNIFLISLARGQIERVLTGHEGVIHALAFSHDGKRLISGSHDHTARIWRLATGACEQTLCGHTDYIAGVAFAPDGRRAATSSFDRTARIWEAESGVCQHILRGHIREVYCIAWSNDGDTLATGSFDHSIRLWDANGAYRKSFDKLGNQVLSLCFTTDSKRLGTAPK